MFSFLREQAQGPLEKGEGRAGRVGIRDGCGRPG